MASRASSTFSGVSVGLPSKVRGSEAEEEWQEVDWVTWSTGEVSVDLESFLLVFRPAGSASSVKLKPLGNLRRAGTVGDDDDAQRTLVVTTDDVVHGQYRFTFEQATAAADFKRLADKAEAAHAAAVRRGAEASSRSSGGNQRAIQLTTSIQEKYAGRWPVIFGCSELYGPSPGGDADACEVLLARGVVVLLDPEEACKTIGEYSLLFFGLDEGASHPVKTFPIGPRMALKRYVDPEETSLGASFFFKFRAARDTPVHMLSFDDEATAATFGRDFRVRSRLMDVAGKTAQGKHAVDEVRNELLEFKRKTVGARLARFLKFLVLLLLAAMIVRVVLIWKMQLAKEPNDYLQIIKKDLTNAGRVSRSVVTGVGSKACALATGSVSASDLQNCLAVGGVSKVHECVVGLVERW